jgi:hypothetical protein
MCNFCDTHRKAEIARKSDTPVETLAELSEDEDWCVRFYVARNIRTTIEILDKLSYDESSDVRYWVACHPNVSMGALGRLSEDESWVVRIAVASHKNITEDIVCNVVGISMKGLIAHALLNNPSVSEEIKNMIRLITGEAG